MKSTVYGAETINTDSTLKKSLCKFFISAGLTLSILFKLAEWVVNDYLWVIARKYVTSSPAIGVLVGCIFLTDTHFNNATMQDSHPVSWIICVELGSLEVKVKQVFILLLSDFLFTAILI